MHDTTGKELHAYAGRECSRALAKGSTEEADLCDDLAGLTAEQEQRLQDKLAAIRSKHDQVGQVSKRWPRPKDVDC